MDHLEAQSYIMPFIEGKVPDKKQNDFVIHMRNCSKCHEELEIYYTLIVGMRQLDTHQNLSTDFNADLEKELTKMGSRARQKKRMKLSAFSIGVASMIFIFAIFYVGILTRVYLFEQRTKQESQGTYYFKNELERDLLVNEYDYVKAGEEIDSSKEISDFERIRGFKRLKEDFEGIVVTGEELLDGETDAD